MKVDLERRHFTSDFYKVANVITENGNDIPVCGSVLRDLGCKPDGRSLAFDVSKNPIPDGRRLDCPAGAAYDRIDEKAIVVILPRTRQFLASLVGADPNEAFTLYFKEVKP